MKRLWRAGSQLDTVQFSAGFARLFAASDHAVACRWIQTSIHTLRTKITSSNVIEPRNNADKKDKTYVDRLKVTARAGSGGKGCVSFWKSASKGKYTPADGGDGGTGGNIIVKASSSMKSLAGVPQLLKADHGAHGSRQQRIGKNGKDTVVLVPTGTVIYKMAIPEEQHEEYSRITEGQDPNVAIDAPDLEREQHAPEEIPQWIKAWQRPWIGSRDYQSGEEDESDENAVVLSKGRRIDQEAGYQMMADLTEHDQQVIVAHGGPGGRGNASMRARPRRPAPDTTTPPATGEVARLLLELKLIADIAFVGYPNAGKSSLLRAVSAATPRVADYQFTTLKPQLGAIELTDDDMTDSFSNSNKIRYPSRKLIVADVPGLIQGASENKGLGHRFLRHIERARALAYILSPDNKLANSTSTNYQSILMNQFNSLKKEVAAYSPALAMLPHIVVVNKIDLFPHGHGRTITALSKKLDTTVAVVGVSAIEKQGISGLVRALKGVVVMPGEHDWR